MEIINKIKIFIPNNKINIWNKLNQNIIFIKNIIIQLYLIKIIVKTLVLNIAVKYSPYSISKDIASIIHKV